MWGPRGRPLLIPLWSSLFLFFSLAASWEVKGLLDFPTGPSLKLHASLGCSMKRGSNILRKKLIQCCLKLSFGVPPELSGQLRKGNGYCFLEFPFHTVMCHRMSFLGPWALPGISFADLLCVQEKGSCHQLPEGSMRQKLPSSLWPRKGLPFTIFWRVQVSDEGGKLWCPFASCL